MKINDVKAGTLYVNGINEDVPIHRYVIYYHNTEWSFRRQIKAKKDTRSQNMADYLTCEELTCEICVH